MLRTYACLFDLDGVIVHTAQFHFIAWRELAASIGFDLTEADNEQLKGLSRVASLQKICSLAEVELSKEDFHKKMHEKNEHYLDLVNSLNHEAALPGIEAFIVALKEQGARIALGSASKNARLILDKIEMTSYFDAIVDGTNTTKSKPDPQVFQLGATALDVSPSHAVVFEDSPSGIKAANSGGFRNIGVGDPTILHEAELVIPDFQHFSIQSFSEFLNL